MILVTGASGLVGSAVLACFRDTGTNVVGTCHTRCRDGLTPLDLTDPLCVSRFFSGRDIHRIIHCSAVIPANLPSNKAEQAYEANLFMIQNLVSAIGPQTGFTFISTTALYDLTGTARLTEQDGLCPITPYQESKALCEKALKDFFQDTDRLCILRLSSPYSIDAQSPVILDRFIQSSLAQKQITLWGSGKRRQALTNTASLGNAVRQLTDKNVSGTFNYVTTPSISMRGLAQKIRIFCPETKILIRKEKKDPEENCQTSIETKKIEQFLTLEDTLEQDIRAMVERRAS